MKIQIDTTQKVIRLESTENLGEFVTAIEQMLPNGLWKEFKIETNTTIQWINPIVWRDIYRPQPYFPTYPSYPWITCGTNNGYSNGPVSMQLKGGVYSIEV